MQPLFVVGLGRGKSFSFFGGDVEQHRPFDGFGEVEKIDQTGHVVAVHRSEVFESQRLEQHARRHYGAHAVLDAAGHLAEAIAPGSELAADFPDAVADFLHNRLLRNPREVVADGPFVRCNRHTVVVQHNDNPAPLQSAVVHRFVGHAAGHSAVAYHRHHMIIIAVQVARGGQTQRGGDRCGGMPRAEDVVLAFFPL